MNLGDIQNKTFQKMDAVETSATTQKLCELTMAMDLGDNVQVNGSSAENEDTIKCSFNSLTKREGLYGSWDGFQLCSNYSKEIRNHFGRDTTVMLASQNYAVFKGSKSSFANVLEIYEIKLGTTTQTIREIYKSMLVEVEWVVQDIALVIFQSEEHAIIASCVQCNHFKCRSLLFGSPEAVFHAVMLAYSKDRVEEFPPCPQSIMVREADDYLPFVPKESYEDPPKITPQLKGSYCLPFVSKDSYEDPPKTTPQLQVTVKSCGKKNLGRVPEKVSAEHTITDGEVTVVIENPYYYE